MPHGRDPAFNLACADRGSCYPGDDSQDGYGVGRKRWHDNGAAAGKRFSANDPRFKSAEHLQNRCLISVDRREDGYDPRLHTKRHMDNLR